MTTITPARHAPLRLWLRLDVAVTGLNGVAYLAGAALLDDVLGVPATTLRLIGAFLLLYAFGVAWVSERRIASAPAVRAVITVNAAWVVASLAVAVLGVLTPTALGTAWIVAQSVVVAAFAVAQWTAADVSGASAGRS